MNWSVICLIVSVILFVLAALNVDSPKVSLGWLGAAFLSLSLLVPLI